MKQELKEDMPNDIFEKEMNDIWSNNQEEYNLLLDLNKLINNIVNQFNSQKLQGKAKYVFPAFIEIKNLYQSAIIILEHKFLYSFNIILRSMMELSFNILYVFKDENNMYRLEKKAYYDFKSKFNYIEKNHLYNILNKDQVNFGMQSMEANIKKLENEKIKQAPPIANICEDLDLKYEYAWYSLLSNYTHESFDTIFNLNNFDLKSNLVRIGINTINLEDEAIKLIGTAFFTIEKIINEYAPCLKKEYDIFNNQYNEVKKNINHY